jgi:hypothetical protein
MSKHGLPKGQANLIISESKWKNKEKILLRTVFLEQTIDRSWSGIEIFLTNPTVP